MSLPQFEERRRTPRHRLGRLATIKLGIGMAPRFCLVTNISEEGVRLHLNGIGVVDEFVLLFPDNGTDNDDTYKVRDGTYKVVWRLGQEIGAKFVSAVTQNV